MCYLSCSYTISASYIFKNMYRYFDYKMKGPVTSQHGKIDQEFFNMYLLTLL